MVESLGNIGYQAGAVGIVVFTLSFLVVTRWWTDLLGRLVAGVLFTISAVLSMTVMRMLDAPLPGGIIIWRVVIFWGFALAVWTAMGTFIWAQFLAPRVRKSSGRMTTRREHNRDEKADLADSRHNRDEKADLADSRHSRDGDLHDRTGSTH